MTATRILHTGVLIQQACEQGSIGRFEPAGPVTVMVLKFSSSVTDAIARHLLIDHCGREDLPCRET
jgi:hypothetical protein